VSSASNQIEKGALAHGSL